MSGKGRARLETAIDPLQPFVARIAVDWLRTAPSARSQRFEGTLVFADVSGFTELTEALARRGREGAEEIAVILDTVFAELLERAYRFDADLLKFGGDAILLLFRGESHATRAASAAVGMQDAMAGLRRLSTSAGPVRLQVSIGVHSGAFDFFLVGRAHRELIVAGPDATRCVETEAIAKAGEIALSETTAALFAPGVLGERRDGVVLLDASPGSPEQVPRFFDPSGIDLSELMPAAYTRELRGEPADPEHRHVAVAFVEIRGTDELLESKGVEVLADALDERITMLQEVCLDYGVTFAQTDVSKEAVKAILLAGAPRAAGGAEEELLLRAARAAIERPGPLPLRVGVNAGRVFAGIVGTPTRRTYTFYGDAINTAARIMARATDQQLLALEGVIERAQTTYATTELEPFAAKGKSELVRASEVGPAVGEREPEADGPFVGRDLELTTLLEALSATRDGHGAVAMVTGEPGLGKTRLLAELRKHVVGSLRVQCAQTSAARPHSTIGAIVRRALQLDSHSADVDVERRLRATVAESAPELEPWLPLLGLVVGLRLPDTPEVAALDERFVSERIATTVEQLLDRIVTGTALVVVDDVHFMDEASADVIGRIVRGIHDRRWLLVVARRAYEGGFEAPEGVEVVRIPLAPLERDAAATLVAQLTEAAPLPAHVVDAIASRSAGSPLFLTEMVAALGEGADLDTLPNSVEALMAVQIDELESADRGVLRRASVLGARFTRSSFATALELDDAQAEATLNRLDGFLVPDGAEGLRFRHGLLRDAAYHGLSFRRRRTLHRRVGEALELGAGDDIAPVAGELTHHFFQAGSWGKSLHYGLVAGSAARAVYANSLAAGLLERAVVAGTRWRGARPETVALAAEALGDVRLSLGEFDKAQTAFASARRRVRGDVVERARLSRKEGNVAYRLGDYAKAQRILTGALKELDGLSSPPATTQRARIEALLGITFLWRGRARVAVEWFDRAITDGESVGSKEALAHAFAGLDLAYNALGESRRVTNSPRALRLYEELGDLVSKGGILNNQGEFSYYAGRWDQALELYRQAFDAWERAGDSLSLSMAAFNIGEILSAQGKLDEAEPLLRSAERSSRAAGGTTDIAESMMETALLDARRGDTARALERLEEARRLLGGAANESAMLLADARIAETLELGGEHDRAAELALQALERSVGSEASALIRPTLSRVLGQAQLAAGRSAEARLALERAITEANEVEHRYEEAMALDALVRVDRLDGVPSESIGRRDSLFAQLGIVALPAGRAPAV